MSHIIVVLKSTFTLLPGHLLFVITHELGVGRAVLGALSIENIKIITIQTKAQSTFYYHHRLTILNNVNDKILLLKKVFCQSKF
jgi:hypothetical protein